MTFKTLMMTAAATALISTGAVAQTATTDGTATTSGDMAVEAPAAEFTSISEMTVGDLLSQTVYQANGDSIGDIDYVIGNADSADVVIGIGGFLSLGEYTVAVPLSELTYDANQGMVMLDRTKEQLEGMAEFDESEAESLPDETPLANLMGDDSSMSGNSNMSDDSDMSSDSNMSGDTGTMEEGTAPETEGADSGMSDDSATSGDTSGMNEETTTEDDALKMEGENSDQAVANENEGNMNAEEDAMTDENAAGQENSDSQESMQSETTEQDAAETEMSDDNAATDSAEGDAETETETTN